MKNYALNTSKILILLIIVFSFGCKSSKKMAAAKAKENARIEQEQAAKLQKQREEEARQRAAEEEKARREAEERMRESASKETAPKVKLSNYFNAIASSSNVNSANNSINEALTLFASPDAPVLIVISEYDGKKDYDRPTTIRNYLNYLKDQKKNINTISNLQIDSSGKITEVELKKQL